MANTVALIALNRFGLGARPGDAQAISANPRAWLLGQLDKPAADPIGGVQDTASRFHMLDLFRKAKDAADKAEAAGLRAPPDKALENAPGRLFDHDVGRRAEHMAASANPVSERLAAFWSNHFSITIIRDEITMTAVPYENEAIRPFVFSDFRTMLGATARHPAMGQYLDSANSIGPDSAFGRARHKAINENYAREVMELHTLGVNGGYTQQDVDELALALTGLGLDRPDGESAYFYDRHEPGPRMLLGHTLPASADQARAALDLLAAHPATIRHVTTKLAVHFCGDMPSRALLQRLQAAWRGSGGHLPAIYRALATAAEAWASHPVKYRSPQDFVLAAARALSIQGHGHELAVEMGNLGQGPFRAPAPTGYPDADADWIGPGGVLQRVASAQRLAALASPDADAAGLLAQIMPLSAGSPTLREVMAERDAKTALALMVAAPEFQRR